MSISQQDDISADLVDDVEEVEEEEAEPENLTKRAWITVIMFAAFVVMTSGCMINLLTR